jgi:ATP-dependent helicase/nuclease subunit A
VANIHFTAEQIEAIRTVDRSVLVTAAAGSGKTAVLAERCAYLVCDAPEGERCTVDELLVLTFTEAAAAEMRSRIHDRVRERLAARPHDSYLRAQLALIETAQISTIHAFCLWMVRRWFHLAGVDAGVAVLDEDESLLMRSEAVQDLFAGLYDEPSPQADRFRRLVEHYGLGRDGEIQTLVLKLFAFIRSQPEPDAWLTGAIRRVTDGADATIAEFIAELKEEIARQREECRAFLAHIPPAPPDIAYRRDRMEAYADCLAEWATGLARPDALDRVLADIRAYTFSTRAPNRTDVEDPDEAARLDVIRTRFKTVKERLFEKRLRDRYCQFTEQELRDGLAAIAPFIETIAELVQAFDARYSEAKRAAGVLDFADLEHFAHRLVCRPEGDVAERLRARFAQVLVDEFQDINPVQEAILHQVSREADPDRADNLFAVGDVKQSIYRFRLAEPQLLLQRQTDFDRPDTPGACVRLQRNYRSRETIVHAVNLLFRPLMREETGGIVYDEGAELRFGQTAFESRDDVPVELHILHDIRPDDHRPAGVSPTATSVDDPALWEKSEREACLIAQRIRSLVSGENGSGGRFAYHQIVILMRSVVKSAEFMAGMLGAMGIPAYADSRGALFDTVEVRDVLSLLEVLDNQQQDIHLAAVLRSGVLGGRFTEDELVAIRLIDRDVPFHDTLRRYAARGGDEGLRERVAACVHLLARYRAETRQRPLADVLWRLYEETGYLAWVGGLPGGAQRRANLLRLHDRARQFGTFHRQGLHRFLRFIDALRDENQDFGIAPPLGETEDVVRIMTIHRSKGLQFPVVFVAGLGRQFNLRDASGRMIYDRDAGIGLRVVDPGRMIEYPSVQHQRVVSQVGDATRAEELRLLYVATTRAEQRLILVGTARPDAVAMAQSTGRMGVSPHAVRTAVTPLEWLMPVLAANRGDTVAWASRTRDDGGQRPLFRVEEHDEAEIRRWRTEDSDIGSEDSTLRAAAALGPLPDVEPRGAAIDHADAVIGRLDYAYPHLAESSVRAVVAASELKRPLDVLAEADDQPRDRYAVATLEVPSLSADDPVSAAGRGTATHTLLEHLRFDAIRGADDVRAEAARLVAAGILSAAEAEVVDVDAVAWFLGTPLGRRVREAGPAFIRERMFLSAEPAERFDHTLGACTVPVIVRGIVDGVLEDGDTLEVIDYKTDRIGADQVAARAERYAMQMRLYARAIERCRRRPVSACWLVFLHARSVVAVNQE